MKFGFLFKKTSTCKGDPNIEYLDETSETKMKEKVKYNPELNVDTLKEMSSNVYSSIDYLTKEEYGCVYAAGYLRDMILEEKAAAPEKWDNEYRKTKITAAITSVVNVHGRYREGIGHKLVFSVSDYMQNKVEKSGLNLDYVLKKEVKLVMKEFQEKFHPGEQIGYAFGIHHDTAHRHIHIFLSNRTKSGKHVAMSNPLKNKVGKYVQKDQIGFIKNRLVVAQLRVEKQVSKAINKLESIRIEEIKVKPESIADKVKESKKKLNNGSVKYKSITNEVLENQEKKLLKSQKLIIDGKNELRELYGEHSIRKDLISTGVSNIERLNNIISDRFKTIKLLKTKTPFSTKLLRKFGYLTNNSELRKISKTVMALQKEKTNKDRGILLEKITQSKDIKAKLVNQVKMLKEERNRFLDRVKQVRKETALREKVFYKQLSEYRQKVDKYNLQMFFTKAVNSKIRAEYFNVLKDFKAKRKSGEDTSKEKEYLNQLNIFVKKEALNETSNEVYAKASASHSNEDELAASTKEKSKVGYMSLKEIAASNNRFSSSSKLKRSQNDKGVSL